MLTELQTRKLPNLFAIHDLNRDGVLEQADFHEYTRRIASSRGWTPESPEYQQLLSRFLTFWKGLEAVADASRDQRVTINEWLAYWDRILTAEGKFDELVEPIAELIFSLLDHNGDGVISADEYALMYSAGGLDPRTAAVAFASLDLDHDGRLTVDEMWTLVRQYFQSNDPSEPGNSFFGPV